MTDGTVLPVKATCSHVEGLGTVGPGLDVCPVCIAEGGVWVHLRQCLTCGRTGCCDSSPNRHASRHAAQAGHPVFRSLEEGEDWSWCTIDESTLRRRADGGWDEVDLFFEAGLWHAHQAASANGAFDAADDAVTDDGFPLGAWATAYRGRRRDGSLDPEMAQALEAVPGWRW
jgi:Zn-finger in ubiquitin-hydrolases and other protein